MNDRDDVIRRLREYRDRIQEILDLIGDPASLAAGETVRARGLYAALKAQLREDVRAGSTIRGRLALTDAEKRFLLPAVERMKGTTGRGGHKRAGVGRGSIGRVG